MGLNKVEETQKHCDICTNEIEKRQIFQPVIVALFTDKPVICLLKLEIGKPSFSHKSLIFRMLS